MSVRIHYRYSGEGALPVFEDDVAENIAPNAPDD